MRAAPTWATQLGDRRYAALRSDSPPEAEEKYLASLRALRARAEASDPAALDPGRRTTRGLLLGEIDDALAQEACRFDEWVVDPMNGPQVDFVTLGELTPIRTRTEADAFVERVRAMGPFLDQHVANLSRGLADGRTAVVDPVEKTISQLAELAALEPAKWAMVDVA